MFLKRFYEKSVLNGLLWLLNEIQDIKLSVMKIKTHNTIYLMIHIYFLI